MIYVLLQYELYILYDTRAHKPIKMCRVPTQQTRALTDLLAELTMCVKRITPEKD
jgi:hypothetical protein